MFKNFDFHFDQHLFCADCFNSFNNMSCILSPILVCFKFNSIY